MFAIYDGGYATKPTLATLTVPFKTIATAIIVTLAIGMVGALSQIIIHDIIPTFYSSAPTSNAKAISEPTQAPQPADNMERGDLFADLSAEGKIEAKPFYKEEQFIWLLRWSHIHLFGINMIFIFLGFITALLDASVKTRTWLIALPFVGVLIDISAMWLKAYISPAFFWLHIPGGGVFAIIFGYVCLRALWEMWIKPQPGDK